MDLQFWIYVIVAIIYLVSRAMKKGQTPPADLPDPRQERKARQDGKPPVEKPKQLTFEELLREITEAKQQQQKPAYQPVETKREEVVNYDDLIGEEEDDLETVDAEEDYRKKDRIYADYEEAKRQAFLRPSLEETLSIRDTNVEFGKFKVFEETQRRNLLEEYTREFQDPEGFKKAVVMSEILKRKF